MVVLLILDIDKKCVMLECVVMFILSCFKSALKVETSSFAVEDVESMDDGIVEEGVEEGEEVNDEVMDDVVDFFD